MKSFKFFASILLMLCLSVVCCAQTKIDWKQIKNIPDTLEFKNVLLEHLLFKSAYQPVMESVHQGAIYYDNMLEKLRVYENGNWRDLSVTIASDSIGAPLTILGYLQASDIYASQSAYIGKDAIIKGKLNASGPAVLESLKVNKTFKVPVTASTTLGVGSIYYDPTTGNLKVLNSSNQWDDVGNNIVVDSAINSASTNPVQNKVIYSYLTGGTSNLNVKSIITTNASVTNRIETNNASVTSILDSKYVRPSHGLRVPSPPNSTDNVNTIGTDDSVAMLYYSKNDNRLGFYISQWGGYVSYVLPRLNEVVTSITTGTANGTVSYTVNGASSNVSVCGLKGAAYTDVDSAMDSVSTNPVQNKIIKSYVDTAVSGSGGNLPVLQPANPSVGQMYYDTVFKVIKFWDGTEWKSVGNQDFITIKYNVSPSSTTGCAVSNTTVVLYQKSYTHNEYDVMISGIIGQSSADSTFNYPSGLSMITGSGADPVVALTVKGSSGDPSIIGVASADSTTVTVNTYDNDGESRRNGNYYFIIRGICTIDSSQASWLQ